MDFTIYDPKTGAILRSGSSHDEADARNQMQEGEAIIIGEAIRDDLFVIQNGKPVDRVATEAELVELRRQVKARIDRDAGFARASILTIAEGQDYVYLRKLAEAEQVINLAAGAADVPMVAAEAEADGMALAQKASQIVAAARAASAALSRIEIRRKAAKANIDAATTRADIEAAAVIDW